MGFKKAILVLLLMIILTMGAASAADNSTDNLMSAENATGDIISVENNDEEIIKTGEGSFEDLAEDINAIEEGGVFNFTKDYEFSGSPSTQITINRTMTIDGRGHTINSAEGFKIFKVSATNVVMKNINFINAKFEVGFNDYYSGVAVNWEGDYGCMTNCSFDNCASPVYIRGTNCSITNCKFNQCRSGGDTVLWIGKYGTMSNCEFVKCHAYQSCGAVYWTGDNGVLSSSNFINCSSIYNGGSIYWTGHNGTLSSSNFINCSSENGGSTYWTGNNGVLSSSNFINCTSYEGGSIHWEGKDGTVSKSNFTNSKSEYGAAIYWMGQNGVISTSRFNYCTSPNLAVIRSSSQINVLHSKFKNNYSGDVENLIDIIGIIEDCTLNEIESMPKTFTELKQLIDYAEWGDTIELDSDYINTGSISSEGITIAKTLTINGKGHTLNANQLSRIFYIIGNSVHLENITFTNGKNIDLGGAICGYDTAVYLLNCTFINNSANQQGGVLYGDGMHISVSDSSFINNTAEYGGAILISGSGDILNSLFTENTADENGGAIDLRDSMSLHINIADCSFEKCLAKNGGAIYIDSESYTLPIDRCDFINCSATQNGGSTYYICQDGQIRYSRFINSSATSGKAIYAGATATISNSEFEDLTAKKLSDVIYGGIITNCTLNENLPKNVDLDISIVSNITGSCQIGDSIEFTVTVTNAGPSDATGTYVSITYSELQIMNSYDTLNGSVVAGNSSEEEMFWTIGNLGAGETATLTITSKTLQTGNSSLSVTVVSSLNDVNTSNNAASSIISILAKASTLTIDTNINGSSVTLMFTIPEDAMGTISITVDGTNYNKTPVGGKSSLNLNLAAGTYPVSATYSGDVKYMPTTNNTLFIVNTIAGNTFTDLKSIIDAASPGDTIKLEDDYTNDGTITADGIAISKAITIDGNGHTLNANGKSRTFVINTSGVTIKNTIFTNGHQDNTGSAIYWSGCTVNVLNCTFINNAANYDGGAIGWTSSPNSSVSNCTFINNTAQMGGGAIYSSWTNNWSISNCVFINSYARYDGGAIITWGDNNGLICNCTFEDNSAGRDGETVFWYNGNGNIDNSKFININKHGGKVIYSTNTNVIISNSNFEDETVENLNDIIYGGTVINCTLNSPSTKIDPSMTITTTDIHYGENATINVSISNDATGSIIITVDNNEYELQIIDGKATLTINNLETGTYTAYATYTGDMKYLPANASSTFTVSSKANKTFTDLKNLIDAASPKDTIKLEDDYTNDGSITADGITISKAITIDGKGHTLDAKGSSRIFKINAENVTLKNIIFKNGHGNNGGAIQWMNTKGVAANCTFINCSAKNGGSVYWNGENGMINTSTFDHSTATSNGGAIYWNANNGEIANSIFTNSYAQNGGAVYVPENKNVEIKSSIFDSNIAEEESGAVYGGTVDDDCTFKNNTYTPLNTTTIVSINETAVYTGNDISITTIVLSQKGGFANTGTVEIYINSKLMATIPANTQYIHTTGEIGTYQVLAKFIDDSSYKNSSSTAEFTVIPVDIPEEIETSTAGIFTLEFPDDAEGTLTVFLDGTKYKVYDIIGGILKIDLSDKKGKYNITFEYSGDDNYPAFKKDANITVETNPSITASNAKVIYSAGTTYKITVYKNKGITANGVNVVIKQNNKKLKPIKTNSKGIASFKVTQTPGTYKLKITSLGKTVTKTLTVKHIVTLKTATVKKSAKKLILQATLKGVAKVTIKKSVLKKLKIGKKITYQATYLKDTVKKTVKVKK